ncbi:hypothetical protein [Streptomyces sp. NPDC005953]
MALTTRTTPLARIATDRNRPHGLPGPQPTARTARTATDRTDGYRYH